MQGKLKILFGHANYRQGIDEWYQEIINAAPVEMEIKPFTLTLNPPSNRLSWIQLDEMWKRKDKTLIAMYQKLICDASDCDIFINYNGINIHPEFLECLPTKNIFCSFDDPESSEELSKYVAASYDAVFYGNISSRFQYESWGCKKNAWLPIFSSINDFPSLSEKEELLFSERENDVVFIGELNKYKQKRMEILKVAFPQAQCYGRKGWENGSVSKLEKEKLYRTSKIGWNIHNSTGPINLRLFMLPAFGIMQICDNKTGLGQIFKLGEEVIGFDTISETIDLTKYYLNHDHERTQIAQGGYQRFWKDYHPTAIWQRIMNQIKDWGLLDEPRKIEDLHPIPTISFQDKIKHEFKQSKMLVKYLWNETKIINKVTLKNGTFGSTQIINNNISFDDSYYVDEITEAYIENKEIGAVNQAKERVSSDLPLEWPNIIALNWAVTSLIGNAKKIIEIGSGTGAFAYYASFDSTRTLDCFEKDDFARNFAINRCQNSNVNFFKDYGENLKNKYDLLTSIEVIEHVLDVNSYLVFCSKLAPRAIFSSPNRLVVREKNHIGPPNYLNHVREYAPGEMYWILKQYYKKVHLYYMPDVYVPWLNPMTLATVGTPIIAECNNE